MWKLNLPWAWHSSAAACYLLLLGWQEVIINQDWLRSIDFVNSMFSPLIIVCSFGEAPIAQSQVGSEYWTAYDIFWSEWIYYSCPFLFERISEYIHLITDVPSKYPNIFSDLQSKIQNNKSINALHLWSIYMK